MPVMFVFPRVLKINTYGLAIIVWDYVQVITGPKSSITTQHNYSIILR